MPDCVLQAYLANGTKTGGKTGNCSPNMVATGGWGFDTRVCQKHFETLQLVIENAKGMGGTKLDDDGNRTLPYTRSINVAPPLRDDYARIAVLMQTPAAVDALIEKLVRELDMAIALQASNPSDLDDRFRVGKDAVGGVRLSRVLGCYEGLCHFPESRTNLVGLLTNDDFHKSISLGYMPKDPGARALHGDLTHRFQWHAIMRVMTGGFDKPFVPPYAHSPLELFVALGNEPWKTRGLWGMLFDSIDGVNYSNPDNLYRAVREKTYGVFRGKLTKVYDKRLKVEAECEILFEALKRDVQKFTTHMDQALNTKTGKGVGMPDWPTGLTVASKTYEWKKRGGPPANRNKEWAKNVLKTIVTDDRIGRMGWFGRQYNTFTDAEIIKKQAAEAALAELVEVAALRFWRNHIDSGDRSYTRVVKGDSPTKYGATPAGMFQGDGVAQEVGASPAAIAASLIASRNGLNTATYQYGSMVGAWKP